MLSVLLGFLVTLSAHAQDCREESLVTFLSGGQPVASELIGAGNACDHFGGNKVITPKHKLFVYVNFNIAGTIDLDQVDAMFEKAPANGPLHDFFQQVALVAVSPEWMREHFQDEREAILNLSGDTLFLAGPVVTEGRLIGILERFYTSAKR